MLPVLRMCYKISGTDLPCAATRVSQATSSRSARYLPTHPLGRARMFLCPLVVEDSAISYSSTYAGDPPGHGTALRTPYVMSGTDKAYVGTGRPPPYAVPNGSLVVMPPCFATRYCHLQRQCHHFWRQCCHFGCSTSIYGCSATVFGGSADVFFWGGHVQHNEAGREWMCLDLGSVRQASAPKFKSGLLFVPKMGLLARAFRVPGHGLGQYCRNQVQETTFLVQIAPEMWFLACLISVCTGQCVASPSGLRQQYALLGFAIGRVPSYELPSCAMPLAMCYAMPGTELPAIAQVTCYAMLRDVRYQATGYDATRWRGS
eukprot:1283488-Rhodomonas_salina.2